jgi:monoamine oxidase
MSDNNVSRRGFLGGGAAAGAAIVAGGGIGGLPQAEAAARKKRKLRTRRVDVVVVGGGFAGLTAAYNVMRKGHSVLLLEARNRVGGRVFNHEIGDGEISEAGGTFFGPTQDRIKALADTVGVGSFKTFNEGDNVYIADGSRSTYSDTSVFGTAPPDPLVIGDLATIVSDLDEKSKEVPVDAPWTAAKAREYDGQTLDTYIRNTQTPVAPERFQKLVGAATRPIFGAEATEISLLFTLFYIASSGNEQNPGTFERNFNTRDGAQESRFIGGSQAIAQIVAKRLGKRVVLKSPVRQIRNGARGVSIISDRINVRAKRVIVAVPPVLAGRIDYSPDLPPERDQLTQKLPQGTLGKVAAVYDKPFWRDKGLNGTSLNIDSFISATFDDSPPDGSPGVVFGFIGGDKHREFFSQSADARRAAALKDLSDAFGAEAGSPTEYFETNWPAERWSRGGPVGVAGPGVYTALGPALRKPIGRIHWAGTETSNYWNGYMDGAVRSGERAAREVLDQL